MIDHMINILSTLPIPASLVQPLKLAMLCLQSDLNTYRRDFVELLKDKIKPNPVSENVQTEAELSESGKMLQLLLTEGPLEIESRQIMSQLCFTLGQARGAFE